MQFIFYVMYPGDCSGGGGFVVLFLICHALLIFNIHGANRISATQGCAWVHYDNNDATVLVKKKFFDFIIGKVAASRRRRRCAAAAVCTLNVYKR